VAAFYLLRLRAWARIGLEIIYWFDLVICSVSAVFIILMWKVFHSVMSPILKEMEISPEGMPEFSYMYNQMIYTSVSLAITLSFVILMIILLRWETVRNAVNPMKEEHNPIAPC
jgi:TRAP-type C4-dicarboxylate transport system permease small subunit